MKKLPCSVMALEKLSDDVRRGIPISMGEALCVIEYQEKLRQRRASLPWYKRLFT